MWNESWTSAVFHLFRTSIFFLSTRLLTMYRAWLQSLRFLRKRNIPLLVSALRICWIFLCFSPNGIIFSIYLVVTKRKYNMLIILTISNAIDAWNHSIVLLCCLPVLLNRINCIAYRIFFDQNIKQKPRK